MTQTIQEQEYQSSTTRFLVRRKPRCLVEIEASPSAECIRFAQEEAAKQLSKHVSIPGFRKGHAPQAMVKKRFPSEWKKESNHILLQKTVEECRKTVPLNPIDEKNIKAGFKNLSENEAQVSIFFETAPEIPSIEPNQLTLVPVEGKTLSEEMVEEMLRQTLFFYATWESIENRPVQEGDFVILDGEIIESEPHSPLFRETRFEVKDSAMSAWMKPLILGKQVGDVVEGVSSPDEDVPEEEKALFPPTKVRLTIQKIEKPTFPELTPEILEKLGVSSEQELKEHVRKTLQEKLEEEVKQKLRKQAEAFLSTTYPIEIPFSSVQNELHFRCSALERDPEFIKQWSLLSESQRQDFLTTLEKQCERSIRLFHIAKGLFDQGKITISHADLSSFLSGRNTAKENQDLLRAEAISHLLLEKLLDYTVTHATKS